MAYQIIDVSTVTTTATPIGLGIALSETSPIFKTIYNTTTQAKENLKTLLLTRKGERYMEPNFGTDLLGIVFQQNVAELKQIITDVITNPISYWLPYINVEDLTIITAEDDPELQHNVKITLVFSVGEFSTASITLTANADGSMSII